ncbi:fimbrial protein [Pseudomonas sp. C2B4]|uniref:fimbrial protein n=1 Tax=Pseudomonas sp. C2B4 TaxID=2735270 RepID=UPI001586BCA2|nr:fimbrial protein [Pseudomonas sp. C2B4]NUU34857.1 fimbrial protein [Pseudomonas sp. C2B4]
MHRYLLLLVIACLYSQTATALSFEHYGCNFQNVQGTTAFTADLATAPIGSQVGTFEASGTVTHCVRQPGDAYRYVRIALEKQLPYTTGHALPCRTTIPNIELRFNGACLEGNAAYGPTLIVADSLGTFPQYLKSDPAAIIKVGPVPPGNYNLAPIDTSLVAVVPVVRNDVVKRLGVNLPSDGGSAGSDACSLVSTNVNVDFGEVSDVGGTQPFSLEFGNCSDINNAVDYVFATALKFSSERIRSDGTALRNGTCTNCAKGIQIRLKNANGRYIDLSKLNSLSGNGTSFTDDGFRQNFTAELERNPDEAQTPGTINTQLVFETVLD